MECIFCKIINGEIPSFVVYEDEKVKAFLDVNPISNGHTLIVPKQHFENIYDIDIENLMAIENASKKVAGLLKEKLGCKGITRVQNNEYGQDVKHYHMHLIPRYENDNLKFETANKNTENVEETYKKIKM